MKIRAPFFVINPKSYLYGEELLDLAKFADEKSKEYDIDILFTAPYIELKTIVDNTKYLIVTSQHMDSIPIGRGMGKVIGEMLISAGVKATFLNHVEYKISNDELEKTILICKQLNIQSIVCANSIEDAEKVAKLGADIIICEQDELVGTGKTSSDEYMISTNRAIRKINKDIKILQAAGISNPSDVYRAIYLGADATGGTSGIIKAENPKKMINDMIKSMILAYKDRMNYKGDNNEISS